MIFSISGLIITIVEYEYDLSAGGFKALGLISDGGANNSEEV